MSSVSYEIFISWRKCELQDIDRIRKPFTLYGKLHPKSVINRLNVPGKQVEVNIH